MTNDVYRKECEQEGCTNVVPQAKTAMRPSMWDLRRARDVGWFIQRDGKAWCPEHVPEWVANWRAIQKGGFIG